MRTILTVFAVLVMGGVARADSLDDVLYEVHGRRRDEITAKYGPPSVPVEPDRDNMRNYLYERDEYDEAIQRLTQDKLNRIEQRQKKIQEQLESDDTGFEDY